MTNKIYFIVILFMLCCFSGCVNKPSITETTIIPSQSTSNLTLTVINVGQGDSEWIVSPSGKTMLIDAGNSVKAENITSVLKDVTYIDDVVVTHPHSDHIAGIQTIFTKYKIGGFFDSGYKSSTAMYTHMMKTINEKNIPYTSVKNGQYIEFDPLVNVSVLNPQIIYFDELNDNSVVLLITYNNVSFLLTGDAGTSSEMIYSQKLNNIDVLKVSHHGSTTGTGAYLLSKTTPSVSIISVGSGNSYGHPDKTTINKLKNSGSTLYRTDLNGSIMITTNGEQYSVITET